ncbi:MAG: hypothetical protein ABF310_09260 [Paracoccaceae bacterium]|jgi:hypothetical protein
MPEYRPSFAAVVFVSVLAFGVYWGLPTRCVQLPNGLNIGKQAVIDLSEPFFIPDIVPKFKNGKSLLPGDAWPFYATNTTVHGLADGHDTQNVFWFAWRHDTGLVLRKDNPELYETLVSEAGAPMGNKGISLVDSHVVMMELQEQPNYANQKCRTRWIRW